MMSTVSLHPSFAVNSQTMSRHVRTCRDTSYQPPGCGPRLQQWNADSMSYHLAPRAHTEHVEHRLLRKSAPSSTEHPQSSPGVSASPRTIPRTAEDELPPQAPSQGHTVFPTLSRPPSSSMSSTSMESRFPMSHGGTEACQPWSRSTLVQPRHLTSPSESPKSPRSPKSSRCPRAYSLTTRCLQTTLLLCTDSHQAWYKDVWTVYHHGKAGCCLAIRGSLSARR